MKSSDIRVQLQALDELRRDTELQLSQQRNKQKSLQAEAEKLQITKLQSENNLLEIDRKIRSVSHMYIDEFCLMTLLVMFSRTPGRTVFFAHRFCFSF